MRSRTAIWPPYSAAGRRIIPADDRRRAGSSPGVTRKLPPGDDTPPAPPSLDPSSSDKEDHESKTTAGSEPPAGSCSRWRCRGTQTAAFMLGLFGLVLFVPFLAYICSLLRSGRAATAGGCAAAFGAGLMGMTLKVMSGVPEIAYRGIPAGSQAHRALEGLANAATVVSLYPFAHLHGDRRHPVAAHRRAASLAGGVCRASPRSRLLVNGSFKHAGTVPPCCCSWSGRSWPASPCSCRDVAGPCHRPSAGCGELRASNAPNGV